MRLLVLAAALLILQAASPRDAGEPLAVLNAERAWADADALWRLMDAAETSPGDRAVVRRYAIRAIGRTEQPANVRRLLALPDVPFAPTASAIAQSLNGFKPENDPALLADVATAMRHAVEGAPGSTPRDRMNRAASLATPMSHIAYATAGEVTAMESLLREALREAATSAEPPHGTAYLSVIEGLEALQRVNAKVAQYDRRTIELLEKAAAGQTIHGDDPRGRLFAFMALVNARALTPDIERTALHDADWTVRRAATVVLVGGGGGLDDEAKLAEIRRALGDRNPHVRYDAVRAWGRQGAKSNGCQPLVDALKDEDSTVALQAFDLLGTLCLDDQEITKKIAAASTVPTGGDWHRPTHAFVALAKRSPDAAAADMEAFATHPVWWVRMYAASAAAGAKDLPRLERLAYDENDNVREAAIRPLQALDRDRAERAMLTDLERTDIQLVHTVAGLIKEAAPAARWVRPLVTSLDGLTRLHSLSSRDGRIALLDALERHARPEDAAQLAPYLKDFDPVVAGRAADLMTTLSGSPAKAEPAALVPIQTQPFADLNQCVVVNMSPGRPFRMRMNPAAAPIAVETFLQLATVNRYYNGLTIHRVVPNFVIQGGSPGANEYSGYKQFLRDEIDASNVRGSVGLSIRGRNTGDAQFYVNLIDNPRLDGGFTIFAQVFADDMEAVDRIQEGDVMRSIETVPCAR